jgi:hypothetical protein
MRVFFAAVVTSALLTTPAFAEDPSDRFQPPSGFQVSKGKEGGRPMGGGDAGKHQKTAAERQADEAAYKAALEKIPSAGQKYDPWSGIRK